MAEGQPLPWVCVAFRSPQYGSRTFPEALAILQARAARKVRTNAWPAGTRLRVRVTRTTASGSVWLDGEPLPPTPVDDWGPPPAGAPCTCTPHPAGAVYGWSPECIQHGEPPDGAQ